MTVLCMDFSIPRNKSSRSFALGDCMTSVLLNRVWVNRLIQWFIDIKSSIDRVLNNIYLNFLYK
jgi:hypothetical protein